MKWILLKKKIQDRRLLWRRTRSPASSSNNRSLEWQPAQVLLRQDSISEPPLQQVWPEESGLRGGVPTLSGVPPGCRRQAPQSHEQNPVPLKGGNACLAEAATGVWLRSWVSSHACFTSGKQPFVPRDSLCQSEDTLRNKNFRASLKTTAQLPTWRVCFQGACSSE